MPTLSPARRHLGALAVALLLDAAFGEPRLRCTLSSGSGV
jgi:hypothetical protein